MQPSLNFFKIRDPETGQEINVAGFVGPPGPSGDGSGDMHTSTYDPAKTGTVNNARKLGGKLPSDYADATHTHSADDVNAGTLSADRLPVVPVSKGGTGAATAAEGLAALGGVPTTRTVNGKALSDNISLAATDVGAIATETDPTVPAWAKQPQKPAYTHTEVGAAAASHTHTIANVTALQGALDGKAASSHTHAQADVTGLSGALEGKADLTGGKVVPAQISAAVVVVTGNYTLVLSDAGKQIEVNAASDVTITVPDDASVAFPAGTEIEITQEGAGKVTIAAADGVTLNSLEDMREIAGQYGAVALKKRGTNDWRLAGGLA